MESSAVLRMLLSSFLTAASTKKLSMLNLGSSSFPRVFPKSVSMVNARRIPRSVTKLQAWKSPNKSTNPFALAFNEDTFHVGVGPVFDDEEMEVVIRNCLQSQLGAHVIPPHLGPNRYTIEEDDDALYLKFDLPVFDGEFVRVNFFKYFFFIRIVNPNDEDKILHIRKGSGFPLDGCNVMEAKAEMMFGVLKIVIPKIKGEEMRARL